MVLCMSAILIKVELRSVELTVRRTRSCNATSEKKLEGCVTFEKLVPFPNVGVLVFFDLLRSDRMWRTKMVDEPGRRTWRSVFSAKTDITYSACSIK